MSRRWHLPPGWPHASAPHTGLLVGLILAALIAVVLTVNGACP